MLANFDLGWAWLHNPKAGGMAMSRWLHDHMGFDPLVPVVFDEGTHPHCKVCGTVTRHCVCLIDALCTGYDVKPFCSVRAPILRTLSGWAFYQRKLGYEGTVYQFIEDQILVPQAMYVETCVKHEGVVLHQECLEDDAKANLEFVHKLGWNYFPEKPKSFTTSVVQQSNIDMQTVGELVFRHYENDYGYMPEYKPFID